MISNYEEVLANHTVLEGDRLILRPFTLEDAPDVLEYTSDVEVLKYLNWEGAFTMEEVYDSIQNFYLSRNGIYAITLKDTKKCIGCIDVRLNPEHEKATFGYMLNRNYWNNGYMSEALSCIFKLCFNMLDLNRIESTHFLANPASGRVMQKNGMKQEGVFYQESKIKGKFIDHVHYAILKEEYTHK